MEISTFTKVKATALLMAGKKLEAIQYLQEQLSLPLKDATTLADHLEKELSVIKHRTHRSSHSGGPVLKFSGLFFLVAGLTGCGIIGNYIWEDEQFIKKAELTQGTVVAIEESVSVDDEGRSSTGYYPVFEYSFRGATGRHTSTINFGSTNYLIGELVDVYVDPSQPDHVIIDTFTERWGYYLLFGAFALMFTIMGIVMMRI